LPARFCFTVDLDRDVNVDVPGRPEAAASLDRGSGNAPRFESTMGGLSLLVDVLDELSLPCTFFCEGRTLEVIRDHAGLLDGFEIGVHGYDHEVLPLMDRSLAKAALMHGCEAVYDVLGHRPLCFRAPYMKMPEGPAEFLGGTGICTTSTTYAPASECRPYAIDDGITDVPVAESIDSFGKKISAYLWPMHEGKRNPQDYVNLAHDVPSDGVYVLADHTWHMMELRSSGILSGALLEGNVSRTREALSSILDSGVIPTTISSLSL